MRDGFGKLTFLDSDTYEGEWYFNKRHGTGEYRMSNGKTFKGEWKDNDFESKCLLSTRESVNFSL